jgi:predicted RNA-binding protein YlqC (UPF0109 family)
MSAFDDEFGLFDDEVKEDEERKPVLGARKIASNETIIDDIEPEDENARPRRRTGNGEFVRDNRPPMRRDRPKRDALAPDVAQERAVALLTFLVQKLVANPDAVVVTATAGERGPVLELEVDPDDLGKIIGRAGRVAQALRTVVRAGAEGRVTIDIVDVDEATEADAQAGAEDDEEDDGAPQQHDASEPSGA